MLLTAIIFAALAALVKFVLLWEVIGPANIIRFRKPISIFFAIILPLLFTGTLTGMMTALLSGIFLSSAIAVTGVFVKPQPLKFEAPRVKFFGKRNKEATTVS